MNRNSHATSQDWVDALIAGKPGVAACSLPGDGGPRWPTTGVLKCAASLLASKYKIVMDGDQYDTDGPRHRGGQMVVLAVIGRMVRPPVGNASSPASRRGQCMYTGRGGLFFARLGVGDEDRLAVDAGKPEGTYLLALRPGRTGRARHGGLHLLVVFVCLGRRVGQESLASALHLCDLRREAEAGFPILRKLPKEAAAGGISRRAEAASRQNVLRTARIGPGRHFVVKLMQRAAMLQKALRRRL